MAQQLLEVVPSQVQFRDVLLGKGYSQLVAITNRSSTSIEASIRPSSSDRYSVHPKQLKLKSGQTCDVELKLKVTKFAQIEKAVQQGQRDAIHIKTPHFADQQFYVYFFLDPSEIPNTGKGQSLLSKVPATVTALPKDTNNANSGGTLEFLKLDAAAVAGFMASVPDSAEKEHGSIRLHAPGSPPSPVTKPATARAIQSNVPCGASPAPFVHEHVQAMVHATLTEERTLQEQRNKKILTVLQEKDRIIHELQVEHGRLHAEIHASEKIAEEAKQGKVVAERSLKAAEAQLRDERDEHAAVNETWQKRLSKCERELSNELQSLHTQMQALGSQSVMQSASADDEINLLQNQLHKAKMECIDSMEKKVRADAEIETLRRKLDAADQLALELQTQVKDLNGSSSKFVENLQAEHQSEVLKLHAQMSELQDLQRREDVVQDTSQEKTAMLEQQLQNDESMKMLQDRITVLEATNATLEEALLHGCDDVTSATNVESSSPTELQADLDEASKVELHSKIEAPHSTHAMKAGLDPELQGLQDMLANQKKQISIQQIRIAKLESLHELAQDSALACESELVSCQSALASSQRQNDNLFSELQNSKVLAAQLNSRVTDLLSTCAATQSDSEINMSAVRRLHATEVAELQQETANLLRELECIKQKDSTAKQVPAFTVPTSIHRAQFNLPHAGRKEQEQGSVGDRTRERQNSDQTCMDTETAVASLHQQLLNSEEARSKPESRGKATVCAVETLQVNLDQKVGSTAEESTLKVKLLEDTVQWLTSRGIQQSGLAKLSTEAAHLLRMNTKLKSDLMYAEERVQSSTSGHASEAISVTGSTCKSALHGLSADTEVVNSSKSVQAAEEFHRAVARLVERAESAETELATVNLELNQLKAKTQQPANDNTISCTRTLASQALDVSTQHLGYDVVLKKYQAGCVEEAIKMQEDKILQLQFTLAQYERELEAVRRRASLAEEQAQTAPLAANASLLTQVKELKQDAASACLRATLAETQKQAAIDRAKQAEAASKTAKDEACKKQRDLDAAQGHIISLHAEVEAAERSGIEATAILEKKLCHAGALASERAMQLSVLTDTVEALQANQHSDRDQRIVNLTAQLVASRGCEASQRCRSSDLLAISERHMRDCVMLEHAKDALQARCHRAEADSKSLHAQCEEQGVKTERLQQQLLTMESEAIRLKQEIQHYQQRLFAAEIDIKSLEKELADSTSRHFQQQRKSKQDINEAHQSHLHKLLDSQPCPQYLQDFTSQIQECLAVGRQATAECVWQESVLTKLQELVIASDRERCIAVTDMRIAKDEAAMLASRLQAVEQAQELHQLRAVMYAHRLSLKASSIEASEHQAQVELTQTKELLQAHIGTLHDQLMHAQVKLKDAISSVKSASEAAQARQQEVQELSESLREINSQLDCATSERDALKIQMAGHSSAASNDPDEARAARDAEIKDYVCSHIAAQVNSGHDVDQLTIFSREIAAVKLSESQLLADLTASEKRCDAYIMRAKLLETELCRYQRHDRACNVPAEQWLSAASAGDTIATAELQNQLSCKNQELNRLRCECVALRQQGERQLMQIQNLSAESKMQKQEIDVLCKQCKTSASAACKSLQEQSIQQKQALEAELSKAQQSVESLQAVAQEKEASWQKQLEAFKAKLEQAVKDSLDAQAAQSQRNELEAQVSHLAQELSEAYAEVSGLQTKLESREESIRLLECGLSAIERRCANAPAHQNISKAAYASLTKQILQSSKAQAEAHRRLKVAAREAVCYQQRLAEQSQRIQELKTGCIGMRTASRRRCVSADRCRRGIRQELEFPLPNENVATPSAVQFTDLQAEEHQGITGRVAAPVHVAPAQKYGEIHLLKEDVSSAASDHGPQDLLEQVGKCVGMLSHALAMKLPHACHEDSQPLGVQLEHLCSYLLDLLPLCGVDHQSELGIAKAPSDDRRLIESQGYVISSLTVRIEAAGQQLAAAKQESSRLRERLRVLRESIGDFNSPESENTEPVPDVFMDAPLAVEESRHITSNVEGTGLTILLQSHLNTILQQQRQLTEALEISQWHGRSPDGSAIGQHVLLQPLQQSARELAAMEATLHVLSNAVLRPHMRSNSCMNTDDIGQSTAPRKPLQPLMHTGHTADDQVHQAVITVGESQTDQCAAPSDGLNRDLADAQTRVHDLEMKCRSLRHSADEATTLQSQLQQTSKQCTEWQKRYTDTKQELQQAEAAAIASNFELQNRIHELQMVAKRDKSSMGSQIAQLEHQINVLESDKAAALQNAERLTAEMIQSTRQANSKDDKVEKVQQELRDQQGIIEDLQSELAATRKTAELEKQERMKLLKSLRGTIEQVRAAGQEEEHLQGEVSRLALLVAQERHLRRQCEEDVARHQQDNRQLQSQVFVVSKHLLDSQNSAKQQALVAQKRLLEVDNQVHSLHEQLDMAESAFARRLDDLSNGILSISEHLQLPREMIEEIEALDGKLKHWGASFEEYKAKSVSATKLSCQRELNAEREQMQKELKDLQAHLHDCQERAEAENTKLRTDLSKAQKEADLTKCEVDELRARLAQLEKQASDQADCEEADRKEADERHREQLKAMQEGHETAIRSMHSTNSDLKLQVKDVLNENAALLVRVKAAESVAEVTAKEMSQLDSSMRENIQVLKERHASTVIQMRLQIDQTQAEFQDYQRAKKQEVCGLVARIRELLTHQPSQECGKSEKTAHLLKPVEVHSACDVAFATEAAERQLSQTYAPEPHENQCTISDHCMVSMIAPATPTCSKAVFQGDEIAIDQTNIGRAAAHDAILAAKREQEFEKILRGNAEADMAVAQRSLCKERMLMQKLQRQLTEAESKGQLVPKLEEKLKHQEQQVVQLRASACRTQANLRECKAELLRKASRLKALQEREKQDIAADHDLKKECEAHALTVCKLEQARRTLSRKSAMIAQLKQTLPSTAECGNAPKIKSTVESQIKNLQAAMARKDEMLSKMRDNRDTCKQMEEKLVRLDEKHEMAVGKLKFDLQRKQALLTAAKAEVDHLKEDLQTAKQEANSHTAGRCQVVNAQQAYAQKVAQALLQSTVALCRLLLRSSAYMQSGSMNLCNAAIAAQACSKAVLQPDHVAELVGLSVREVTDLMGTPMQDVTSVAARGSATVIHIAKLLTATHKATCQLTHAKSANADSLDVKEQLSALTAVLEAETKKSQSSLDSCISHLAAMAQAIIHNPDAPAILQDTLRSAPKVSDLPDQLDGILMASIEFYQDSAE